MCCSRVCRIMNNVKPACGLPLASSNRLFRTDGRMAAYNKSNHHVKGHAPPGGNGMVCGGPAASVAAAPASMQDPNCVMQLSYNCAAMAGLHSWAAVGHITEVQKWIAPSRTPPPELPRQPPLPHSWAVADSDASQAGLHASCHCHAQFIWLASDDLYTGMDNLHLRSIQHTLHAVKHFHCSFATWGMPQMPAVR